MLVKLQCGCVFLVLGGFIQEVKGPVLIHLIDCTDTKNSGEHMRGPLMPDDLDATARGFIEKNDFVPLTLEQAGNLVTRFNLLLALGLEKEKENLDFEARMMRVLKKEREGDAFTEKVEELIEKREEHNQEVEHAHDEDR